MGACVQKLNFSIVSEYCTRGSLYDILYGKRGRKKGRESEDLPWSFRLRLALGAARGLLYLHTATPPLVHNQIKRYVVICIC